MSAFARLCTAKLVTSAMFWRVSRPAGAKVRDGSGLPELAVDSRREMSKAEIARNNAQWDESFR
jgi:hypothetical protein